MNAVRIIAVLIGLCVSYPIWFYLMYQVLEKVQATELMWFLYWIYVPAVVFVVVVQRLTEKGSIVSLNYRETDDECPGCGATAGDRKTNRPSEPQGLSECPQCGTEKCCMCDMGDDVECVSCDDNE